eukprot:c5611_g1_i1.p1 GENE.c5611_g1_i1~~c5611_g1_i1.p1  ORF type:complete len:287 (-),score=49.32 c5611_g1_i1:168-947(-)
MTPYWGNIDATMDWCEKNYVVSQYIAEFWNTVSSVFMLFLGVAGMWLGLSKGLPEKRFQVGFFALSFVGFGSAAYHMTLRRHFQLLDEIPMLLGSHVIIYIQIAADKTGTHWPQKTAILALTLSSAFQVGAYVILGWYWVFLLGYASCIGAMWYFVLPKLRACPPALWRIFILTVVSYYSGFTLWCVEHYMCDYSQPLQLHAWWHILAGYGTFLWIMFLMGSRCDELKRSTKSHDLEWSVQRLADIAPHYIHVKIAKPN